MLENFWHKKEKPLLGLLGAAGGVGSKLQAGGASTREVSVLLWGAQGVPGRGGAPGGAGFVRIDGIMNIGAVLSYVVGSRAPGPAGRYPGGNYSPTYFYTGGAASGHPAGRSSGGFSCVFIGANSTSGSGNSSRILGLAAGSGGGGDDGYSYAYGGAGGGTQGLPAAHEPPAQYPDEYGAAGRGAPDGTGGTGGPPGGNTGAFLQGGAGRPTHSATGGGGGGWYGGGGGGSPGPSEAGGGGGSGMVLGPGSGTVTDPTGAMSFTVSNFFDGPPTMGPVNHRGTEGPGGDFVRTDDPYSPTIGNPTSTSTGQVVIIVDGVTVVTQTTANPTTALHEYTIL